MSSQKRNDRLESSAHQQTSERIGYSTSPQAAVPAARDMHATEVALPVVSHAANTVQRYSHLQQRNPHPPPTLHPFQYQGHHCARQTQFQHVRPWQHVPARTQQQRLLSSLPNVASSSTALATTLPSVRYPLTTFGELPLTSVVHGIHNLPMHPLLAPLAVSVLPAAATTQISFAQHYLPPQQQQRQPAAAAPAHQRPQSVSSSRTHESTAQCTTSQAPTSQQITDAYLPQRVYFEVKERRPYHHVSFPQKLYKMIQQSEQNGLDDIVSWTPCGAAFEVHDIAAFEKEIIPNYFRHTRFSSFRRQLNMYGFKRVVVDNGLSGFANSDFHRDHPVESGKLKRVSEIKLRLDETAT